MLSNPVYVYGLIGGTKQDGAFLNVDIDAKTEPVTGVWHRNIGFAVSRAPTQPLAAIPRDRLINFFLKHLTVIEALHRCRPLIPVKLGTVIDDLATAERILMENERQFTQLLDKFAGKSEWDLTVSWRDFARILASAGEEDAIKTYKEHLLATGCVSEADLVKIGKMIGTELERRKQAIQNRVLAALAPTNVQNCVNAITDEKTVLGLAILANNDQEEELKLQLGEISQALLGEYKAELDFQLVGPLPPKSFATIELNKITGEQMEIARKLLKLPGGADLAQIKAAKRALLHLKHPDKKNPEIAAACDKAVQEIVAAAQLLEEYCRHFDYDCLPEQPVISYIFRTLAIGGQGSEKGAEDH